MHGIWQSYFFVNAYTFEVYIDEHVFYVIRELFIYIIYGLPWNCHYELKDRNKIFSIDTSVSNITADYRFVESWDLKEYFIYY